jgi:hypothetical protein
MDLPYKTLWVTATDVANLTAAQAAIAISLAKTPALPTPTLQSEIEADELVYQTAISNFRGAINVNPANMALPIYDDLQDAVDAAQNILDAVYPANVNGNIYISADGTDVPASAQWAPSTVHTALQTAVVSASGMITGNTALTHADAMDEEDHLELAVLAFNAAALSTGSMPEYIADVTPAKGFTGAEYDLSFASGAYTNIIWDVASGDLPEGLELNQTTGRLSGKAKEKGTYAFNIRVTNSGGGSEVKSYTITIYPAPAVPAIDLLSDGELFEAKEDIVITFPVPMDVDVKGTVIANHPINSGLTSGGYWSTDTTYVIVAIHGYEYDWDYEVVIDGLKDKTGSIVYGRSFSFRTQSISDPTINRQIIFQPLPEGITRDPGVGTDTDPIWVSSGSSFEFALTVPADREPVVQTDRVVDGSVETLIGTADESVPDRYIFVIRSIRQNINITVTSKIKSGSVGNLAGNGNKVWAFGGNLNVRTEKATTVSVYNLVGVLCKQQQIAAGEVTIPLSTGVYIVKLKDGRAYKVVVK